jgi:HSP20 family protein
MIHRVLIPIDWRRKITSREKTQNDVVSFPLHLSGEVERMFDEMIHRPWGFCRDIKGWNPAADLFETDEALILEADLPGVSPQDVKVEVQYGDLVLQGWRTLEKHHREERFHTMERSSGQFFRCMKLPEPVIRDAIQAEFENGVLRVVIPKVRTKSGEAT